ncbi:helix-turn-helix transcriptional regulator [Dactylosporangium sp. NPDC000244]|uniref:helix-turn-helix transcriptional regulator n=1 Tax=Dactylosporangium sp. NPDC000244 TaxID=3154365 RepID=UPI00332EDF30
MPSTKAGTRGQASSTEPVPGPCYFDNDLFMARTTTILGADATDTQRASHVGIARSALNRLRAGDIGLSVRRAKAICGILGVTVDDLFPERGHVKTAA